MSHESKLKTVIKLAEIGLESVELEDDMLSQIAKLTGQPHVHTPIYSHVHSNGRAGLIGGASNGTEESAARIQETIQGGSVGSNGSATHSDTGAYREYFARRRSQRRAERAKEVQASLWPAENGADFETSKEWYSLAEVALMLGRSTWTIGQWCREGKLKAEKGVHQGAGQAPWRISPEEVARYRLAGFRDVCHCRNS